MSQHLIAYYESQDLAAALGAVAAVPDGTVRVSGDDVYVPKGMANIVGAAALGNAAGFTRAQIQSPSLRATVNIDIEPIVAALVFGTPAEMQYHPYTPIPLVENEPVNQYHINNTAVVDYGLIILADGPQRPVEGKIFTVRATGAASLSAGVWVNTALTFSQTLPAGMYQVVGLRVRGANLVAARLFFPGSPWRAGFPAVNAIADTDHPLQRFGRCGVLGEFDNTLPPTLDCLGVTDSTQVVMLDLIKTR